MWFAEASGMSLTPKTPTAAKRDGKPKRQDLAQALAERDAELAEARRQNTRIFDELQAKTRDLEEALQQQAATGDVLKVISRSPALALPEVLQVLIVSAVKLCADDGVIYLKRGDVFVAEADFDGDAEKISARNLTPRRPGRESVTGRVALSGQVEQIPDNLADPKFTVAPTLRLKGIRSMLGVPLLRGGKVAGVFVLGRLNPGLFSDRAVEQARTFADQAVIAIENARLFEEVQAKTRDVEEALEQQTASAEILRVISSSPTDARPVFEPLCEPRANCATPRARASTSCAMAPITRLRWTDRVRAYTIRGWSIIRSCRGEARLRVESPRSGASCTFTT
jgi:two-component system NtrC family sensor kinase